MVLCWCGPRVSTNTFCFENFLIMSYHNGLEFLKKQFFCCAPLNKFQWPDFLDNADETLQKEIINATINNEIILKYPVKQSYKKAFLKNLMDKLEKSGVEIIVDIYASYCDTISFTNEETTMYYKHFLMNHQELNHLLSIKESTNIISEGTTGLCSWNAAFYLAEWCILNKQKILGKNILELGSGVGLTGLTVINFCEPSTYIFSDCHPLVLKTLEENVRFDLIQKPKKTSWKETAWDNELNFENTDPTKKIKVCIKNLNWEEIKLKTKQMQVDLVVAADILYDSSNFEALASGLSEMFRYNIECAIIVTTIRNESTIKKFLNILGKYKLSIEEEFGIAPKMFLLTEETPVKILKIFR